MKFAQFMASPAGRWLRILAGAALILTGLFLQSTGGYVLAAVGLVPLAAGLFDWCLLAPLLNMPFSGKEIRARKG